ncbi:hypothetical protein [Nostoc sp. LEGE 06077]|nr:hypothetical protein [Nostoc sp. LEGE 06077]
MLRSSLKAIAPPTPKAIAASGIAILEPTAERTYPTNKILLIQM